MELKNKGGATILSLKVLFFMPSSERVLNVFFLPSPIWGNCITTAEYCYTVGGKWLASNCLVGLAFNFLYLLCNEWANFVGAITKTRFGILLSKCKL